jgi:hypothetical protein
MQPPKIFQLKKEDLVDCPEWFELVIPQVNQFVQAVATGLTRQLTRADNMRSQVYTWSGTVDQLPIQFPCTLGAKPGEVRIQQVTSSDPNAFTATSATSGAVPTPLSISIPTWSVVNQTTVNIPYLTGLKADVTYSVRFVLEV